MGLLVDIRKYPADNVLNHLVDSSKVKKTWWGKTTDNYWKYLDENSEAVDNDLNSHLIADLFVYFLNDLNFKEILNSYTKTISDNRNCFVTLLTIDDKDFILNVLNQSDFLNKFESYCKKLNGEFYDYDNKLITQNIETFKIILSKIDNDFGLLITIG